MTPARRMLFALAGHLGRFASEIEQDMPATEWLDWVSLLSGDDQDPWGHFRTDSLFMYGLSNLIGAPHLGKPGEAIRDLHLPWVKKSKADGIQIVSGQQMAMFLQSIGGKPTEAKP
jgi:hypothetical protein